jgi:probable rRNA maturation factor
MHLVNINLENPAWSAAIGFKKWKDSLSSLLGAIVQEIHTDSLKFSVNVLLTDDAHMQTLNREFMKKDSPTNVLSFPQYLQDEICKIDTIDAKNCVDIGDIAVSYDTTMRESMEFRVAFFDMCSHLFVHGVLHLFGEDHMDAASAERMEGMEIKVLSMFGISNPYVCAQKDGNEFL